MRSYSVLPVETLTWLMASITAVLAFVFGYANIGFVILIFASFLGEMFLCMWLAILYDDRTFGVRDFGTFWVKKAVLMMLPLVGSGVDWAYYTFDPPGVELPLPHMTTKVVLIGVLAYQLKQVLGGVLVVYKDIPVAERLMHQLDKLMHGGEEPPHHRRAYDPPIENDPLDPNTGDRNG